MKAHTVLLFLVAIANRDDALAEQRCVYVTGQLKCISFDFLYPFDGGMVEIYDADGLLNIEFLHELNKDDLMGRSMLNPNGTYSVFGCGDDVNWLWLANPPDPYLRFTHYCTDNPGGPATFTTAEFSTFKPQHHNAGVLEI